ncbi:MAG: hypothetical protein IBX69_18370 [Anaerolineales bacterium]|nr:hypothetical protein [Anaerolineales bacterium]
MRKLRQPAGQALGRCQERNDMSGEVSARWAGFRSLHRALHNPVISDQLSVISVWDGVSTLVEIDSLRWW